MKEIYGVPYSTYFCILLLSRHDLNVFHKQNMSIIYWTSFYWTTYILIIIRNKKMIHVSVWFGPRFLRSVSETLRHCRVDHDVSVADLVKKHSEYFFNHVPFVSECKPTMLTVWLSLFRLTRSFSVSPSVWCRWRKYTLVACPFLNNTQCLGNTMVIR